MWKELRQLAGTLSGTVKRDKHLRWRESVSTRLDWANGQVWILIEPRVFYEGLRDSNKFLATDFARTKSIKRYNRQLNDLISF